LTKIQ